MASFLTTEDKTRYARMCRVLDITGNILREELLKHIPITDIKSQIIQSFIHCVRSKYKTSKHVIDNAYVDGYGKFDISLLYVLLRNMCLKIEQPTGGWDNKQRASSSGNVRPASPISGKPFPCHNERTLGDDIERIHLTRNDLDHLGAASLTASEFSFYLDQIENVCIRMDIRHSTSDGKYWNALKTIETCPMDEKSNQVYIDHICLAKSVEEFIEKKKKEKTALDILLERSEYLISDRRSRGSSFVETNLYEKCNEALTDSHILFISGNPGEGKTRYAIELLCKYADENERLFLNDPAQLNSIDLNDVRGIVIDNVYGDVAFDEQHWKSWKRRLEYFIPTSKQQNERRLHIFITSRTYIANSSADDFFKYTPTVKLVTTELDFDSKLKMLAVYAQNVNARLIISNFSSAIGFPQACFLYSTVQEFQNMREVYFLQPDHHFFELLHQFKRSNPVDLFTLLMIVYQRGSINLHTVEKRKIEELSDSIGFSFCRQNIRLSLEKLNGSFLCFEHDVYSLSHDSLFDAILKYSAEEYPIPLIETADIQVLLNHVCVEGQSEAKDTMCVYIKKQYASNLSNRYANEFINNNFRQMIFVQSNALYSQEVLENYLQALDREGMLEAFLNVADANESLLVEYSNHGKCELSKRLIDSMKCFLCKQWAKEQLLTALTESQKFGHESTTRLLEDVKRNEMEDGDICFYKNDEMETEDDCESGISSESEFYEDNDLDFHKEINLSTLKSLFKERNFERINDMIINNEINQVDIENVTHEIIMSGKDVESIVPKYLNDSDICLDKSITSSNAAAFITLIEARSNGFRINVPYVSTYSEGIKNIVRKSSTDKLHLVYVFCIITGLWKHLDCDTQHIVTSKMNLEYVLTKLLFWSPKFIITKDGIYSETISHMECIIPMSLVCILSRYHKENTVSELITLLENEKNSFASDIPFESFEKWFKLYFSDHQSYCLFILIAIRSWTIEFKNNTKFFSLFRLKSTNEDVLYVRSNKVMRIILESKHEMHWLYFSPFIPESVVAYFQTLHGCSFFSEMLTLIAYYGIIKLELRHLHTLEKTNSLSEKDKILCLPWENDQRVEKSLYQLSNFCESRFRHYLSKSVPLTLTTFNRIKTLNLSDKTGMRAFAFHEFEKLLSRSRLAYTCISFIKDRGLFNFTDHLIEVYGVIRQTVCSHVFRPCQLDQLDEHDALEQILREKNCHLFLESFRYHHSPTSRTTRAEKNYCENS